MKLKNKGARVFPFLNEYDIIPFSVSQEGVPKEMIKILKKTLVVFMMCLCMSLAGAPAAETHGAEVQTETQAVQAEQTAETGDSEESAFLLILMGGALLIILFAVISAMATVSGAISVAVNMDVDGE